MKKKNQTETQTPFFSFLCFGPSGRERTTPPRHRLQLKKRLEELEPTNRRTKSRLYQFLKILPYYLGSALLRPHENGEIEPSEKLDVGVLLCSRGPLTLGGERFESIRSGDLGAMSNQ